MQVKGTATALATGTTKFKDAGAVWVFNNTSSNATVTVRNADDDANLGTIYVGANSGIVIHLHAGEGIRGGTSIFGTEITAAGF